MKTSVNVDPGKSGAVTLFEHPHTDRLPCHVIDAATLHAGLHRYDVLVVDLRPAAHGAEGYIPGSVHLEYEMLVAQRGKAEGLIPSRQQVAEVLSSIGVQPWHHVVAYDDETGVEAARLLWTLEVAGHQNYAMLDGGFSGWQAAELPVETKPATATPSSYCLKDFTDALIDKESLIGLLGQSGVCLLDTRTEAEFNGTDRRAARVGHIPGAVHFEWSDAVDLFGSGRLREQDHLRTRLHALGVTPDRQIVVYCQTNRRSAHTFVTLKWLGFDNVRAYDGSWSEWGNDPAVPVAFVVDEEEPDQAVA